MKLYVCNTYYHILIAVMKNINHSGSRTPESDLVLCDDGNKIDFEHIKKRLEQRKIFRSVFVIKYPKYLNGCNGSLFGLLKKNMYILFNKLPEDIKKNKYDDVYIFNDTCIIGRLVDKQKIKYILLEDGTDSLKNNKHFLVSHNGLKAAIKKVLKINQIGESKNIKYIEVNDKSGICTDKKLVEVSKKEMFNRLDKQSIETIRYVFLGNATIGDMHGKVLIITQPLYEDGIVNSVNAQIRVYKKIVKMFNIDERDIVFKTHPRENIDYNEVFSNSLTIAKNFPIELLNYFPGISFKKAITISSTAIDLLDKCGSRITLGWGWLDENK